MGFRSNMKSFGTFYTVVPFSLVRPTIQRPFETFSFSSGIFRRFFRIKEKRTFRKFPFSLVDAIKFRQEAMCRKASATNRRPSWGASFRPISPCRRTRRPSYVESKRTTIVSDKKE